MDLDVQTLLASRRRALRRRAVSALGLLTASGFALGWSLGAPA